jgi:hypothetical protein
MSGKRKSAGPSTNNAVARSARQSGSPVEAARKSFTVPTGATEDAPDAPKTAASTPAAKSGPPALSPRRAAQLERKRKRERRQMLTGIGIAVVVIVAVVGVIVWVVSQPPKTVLAGVVSYSGLAQTHVTGPVSYPQSPPVGGPHSPIWQNCGIYDQPIANENGVHSLEHGAVWVTYQPTLDQAAVEQLRALARGKGYVLLTPYTGLSSPVVASAWGLQLKLDSPSDPRLAQFITTYMQGPQTPEPGAACSGGVGTPTER